ncbi:hypothetical protein NFHSH190041_11020 [Shewanella sp. NFH-SH190041]|uniref:peptidylprolyl isomerase n=1 Tax=Shewanella sp. NFH-SH190041 TaxID=2950245 RepID=UPI0021C40A73|nr:peptidylprolyl isomerase [Shewanella sp. NFH-SH190041]BDM63650.1 hypothetical protein NFHSH190041_11020 [Shewanella sp. NFH-SH190041]
MKISQHTVPSIHYRLSNQQGEVLESSFDMQPMAYLHGANNLIPGLENALEGKSAGDIIDVTVEAEDAYGPYHDGLRQEVPLSAFGDIEDIVPGMRFIAETEMGQRPVQVTEVKDDTVIVDGNHPMAGQALVFHVEVVDVREATEEEIAHGHLHAHGGCGDHGGCCGGEGEEGGCCGEEKGSCCGGEEKGGCGCH